MSERLIVDETLQSVVIEESNNEVVVRTGWPDGAKKGANSDITSLSGLTGGVATPTYIDFAAAGATDAERRLAWNPDTGTVQIGMVGGNVQAELGQTLYAYVHNAEGSTIAKGKPVYLYQATGNKASVKLAYNTTDATSAKTFGLAAESIASGANGLVICQGVLDKIDTSAYNEGDTLYLGATAGTLTATKPKAPNHMVYIGVVERANNGNGQIYVRVQNGYELDEIHDVQINSPANGQLIIYDAATSLWKNANLTAGTGISITNGAGSITISAPENGTVTSVATGTGLTGGPITSTGTISLAFADNASNGIEPPFSWTYTRRKREADGSTREYQVEDHAWRLFHALAGADALHVGRDVEGGGRPDWGRLRQRPHDAAREALRGRRGGAVRLAQGQVRPVLADHSHRAGQDADGQGSPEGECRAAGDA